MAIPTRSECFRLMRKMQMPPHIQRHSLLVAEIALYLAELLKQNGARLNSALVEAGALLHDIAKSRSLSTGVRHESMGAQLLHEWGYLALAAIVQDHVNLDLIRLNGPITESLLVNYADKRVKHDQVVSLEERFYDLIDRYAKTSRQEQRLLQKLQLYTILERKIFGRLTMEPYDLEGPQLHSQQRVL